MPQDDREISSSQKPLFSWSAPEFATFEKTKWWYAVSIIAIVLLVGVSLWLKSVLGAILFILVGVLLFVFSTRKPLEHSVELLDSGIVVDGQMYPYANIASFWIFYEPNFQELSLRMQRTFTPVVRVQLAEIDPVEVRELLLRFLPEIEEDEPLIDILARRLKI